MVISKSKYMRGCQCSKALWLSVNKPELADEIQTISTQQGDEVGECARTYFPDAITIPLDRTVEMTNQTTAAIKPAAGISAKPPSWMMAYHVLAISS